MKNILDFARRILEHKLFTLLLLACASVITYKQIEPAGAAIFLTVICLQLVLCENTSATLAPFLMMCVFVCTCYDSFYVFIVYLPLAPVAVMCIMFHLLVYRKKFSIGSSFLPLCMTALAVTLGGLGTISVKEYFAPTALFYTFGLGLGMVMIYLIMRSRYTENDQEKHKKLSETFAFDMYMMGLITVSCVASFYIREPETLLVEHKLVTFQASNNFSTFLMLALPFPLYFTMNTEDKTSGNAFIRLSDLHIIPFALMYLAIILTGSRGGLIFGTVEFIVCLAFAIFNREGRRKLIYLIIAVCSMICMFFGGRIVLSYLREMFSSGIASASESRAELLLRSIDDFKRNILFGSGLGYKGNSDLYSPVQGAMNWYHIYPAQIIGSFGLVGVAAFSNMIFGRFRLFLRRPTAWTLTLGLSYIGILLMSLVNPGEFCPVPYEMLTVMLFIFLENENRAKDGISLTHIS